SAILAASSSAATIFRLPLMYPAAPGKARLLLGCIGKALTLCSICSCRDNFSLFCCR
ncbi:hypothetical protein EJB05_55621, partial [Eragrostis curvula]